MLQRWHWHSITYKRSYSQLSVKSLLYCTQPGHFTPSSSDPATAELIHQIHMSPSRTYHSTATPARTVAPASSPSTARFHAGHHEARLAHAAHVDARSYPVGPWPRSASKTQRIQGRVSCEVSDKNEDYSGGEGDGIADYDIDNDSFTTLFIIFELDGSLFSVRFADISRVTGGLGVNSDVTLPTTDTVLEFLFIR